jgi:hypothetical protein
LNLLQALYAEPIYGNLKRYSIRSSLIFLNFCTIFVAAISTSLLFKITKLDIVIAALFSSLVGFLILKILKHKELNSVYYCGVFIGMSTYSSEFFYLGILFSSLVAAVLLMSMKDKFDGHGGKLGAIAFLSSLIPFLILS